MLRIRHPPCANAPNLPFFICHAICHIRKCHCPIYTVTNTDPMTNRMINQILNVFIILRAESDIRAAV